MPRIHEDRGESLFSVRLRNNPREPEPPAKIQRLPSSSPLRIQWDPYIQYVVERQNIDPVASLQKCQAINGAGKQPFSQDLDLNAYLTPYKPQ